MKIVISGSMTFAEEMLKVAEQLRGIGHTPRLPIDTTKYAGKPSLSQEVRSRIRRDTIRDHFRKIRKSDAILVLNYEKNNIAGYVGPSSLIEMGFAHFLHKKIYLLNRIPDMSCAAEIKMMQPVVLNGRLARIDE